MWACQRCQPMPGARPSSIPIRAADLLVQDFHSWLQASATTAATAAGTSNGALSSSMALAIRPATAPQSALVRLPLSFSRASQSRAMADSWVPSSMARRPCRATGNSVSRITLVARALERSPGRSVHCSQPPRGTTRHDSKAGARRIVHSEGSWLCCVVAPITRAIRLCRPGALLR